VRWGGQAGTLRSQAISISVRGRSHRGVRSYRRKLGRLRWRPKAWQNHRVRRKGVRHLVRCRGKQGVVLGEGTRHVRGRPHCLHRGGGCIDAPPKFYIYTLLSRRVRSPRRILVDNALLGRPIEPRASPPLLGGGLFPGSSGYVFEIAHPSALERGCGRREGNASMRSPSPSQTICAKGPWRTFRSRPMNSAWPGSR